MNSEGVYQIIVLALATGSIATTISKTDIFKSTREWICAKNKWLGELVACSYCISHWIAFAFVMIYQPILIKKYIIIDLFTSVFVVVTLSSIVSGLIVRIKLRLPRGSSPLP